MRDFRNAKAMARTLREGLAERSIQIGHSESLELISRILGCKNWQTVAAAIEATKVAAPKPSTPQVLPSTRAGFSPNLEATLHRAVEATTARKHGYTTLEHLLWALLDDVDAAEVMRACGADLEVLSAALTIHLDDEPKRRAGDNRQETVPTASFHRAVQCSILDAQSSGWREVTGADVLVAVLGERESRASGFLRQQKVDQADAKNFIVQKGERSA